MTELSGPLDDLQLPMHMAQEVPESAKSESFDEIHELDDMIEEKSQNKDETEDIKDKSEKETIISIENAISINKQSDKEDINVSGDEIFVPTETSNVSTPQIEEIEIERVCGELEIMKNQDGKR